MKDIVTKEVVEKCGEYVCMHICIPKCTMDLSGDFIVNLLQLKKNCEDIDILQKCFS